jgi:L-rhamnose mutarotase
MIWEVAVERVCFSFQLKPGSEDEYKRRHDQIWPELVDAIKESGFTNYTLFRRDLQVIAYAECEPDIATAFQSIGSYDVNTRWSKWFEDVIEQLTDEHGHMFFAPEVWHLD